MAKLQNFMEKPLYFFIFRIDNRNNPIFCITFATQLTTIISYYGNDNTKKTNLFSPEN